MSHRESFTGFLELLISTLIFSIIAVRGQGQSVTKVSNTSIVATVGTLECDLSGIPGVLPFSVPVTCSLGGAPFFSDNANFTSTSNVTYANQPSTVGTIEWLLNPLVTGGATFQVSAALPNSTPVVLTGSFLLPALPPAITSSLTASGVAGAVFSYQITATNNPTSYNATGLPAGIFINTASGLISGVPAVAGVTSVTISATNAGGTGTAMLSITIAAPPPSGITRIQTKSGAGGYATRISITPNMPTTTGNCVVVVVSDYYGASEGPWSVSDGTNTYNSISLQTGNQKIQAFMASNVTGTAAPIVITSAVATYWVATAIEYSGLTCVLDQQKSVYDGNYETTYSSGSVTTTQAAELLLGVVHYNSTTATATPTNPWNFVTQATDGSYQSQVIQEQIVNAAGAYAASGVLSTALPHSDMIVTIK